MVVEDMFYILVEVRFKLAYCAGFGIEDRRIAGRAYEFDYHKYHYLWVFDCIRGILDDHIIDVGEIDVFFVGFSGDSVFEHSLAEVFGNKIKCRFILGELVDDIVDDEDNIAFKAMLHI